MSDQAAHMVDRTFRHDVPWRQWVLTFPRELAIGLAFDAPLAAAVTRIFVRVLFEWQRARADPDAPCEPRPGAMVWVQRFSDGAGTYFHLHMLAPDGVFRDVPDSMAVTFEPQLPPTDSDVAALVERVAGRVHRFLRRRGLLAAREEADPDAPLTAAQLLMNCAAVPPQGQVRTAGAAAGRAPKARAPRPLCAKYEGYDLHAAVRIEAHQPQSLERLLRYLGRPPIPQSRVRLLPDGRVAFDLKRPRGSVSYFVFEPIAFVARMAALVPPRSFRMVRPFGVLASGSPFRRQVVPDEPIRTSAALPTAPKRPAKMCWADLLRRVHLIDALACPCGGRLRFITTITDPDVVQVLVAAVIMSHQAPARAPPSRPGF